MAIHEPLHESAEILCVLDQHPANIITLFERGIILKKETKEKGNSQLCLPPMNLVIQRL